MKGKHPASKNTTLFFMPHCPYRLYVNLLWANWDNLENVAILGNSFSSYGLRRPEEEDPTDCVKLLGPLVTERPVWDLFYKSTGRKNELSTLPELAYLENAFCDLSLHYFTRESLDTIEGERILSLRPSESDIDKAALEDVELFG
eukprot:CAMPEP_0119055036 /NCGR_PEP_ID=MMETSP1177-20130426/75471_1 /TAXON_ID=2985 /ORGANISM="Ochromonas sp, Strain CCMP1899" /LENGTH=144 /DNA_ID=CAMNT_0007035477 /DNA_START=554 /DNA_END=988 /DNA_ORIENTATION=+